MKQLVKSTLNFFITQSLEDHSLMHHDVKISPGFESIKLIAVERFLFSEMLAFQLHFAAPKQIGLIAKNLRTDFRCTMGFNRTIQLPITQNQLLFIS
jgi:hypothetical protein